MQTFSLAVVLLLIGAAATFAQCPTISVIGPAGVTEPGEKMIFRADGGRVGLKHSWTVNQGTIIEGQGTPAITVATDRSTEGSNVIATVTIDGLGPSCAKVAVEVAPVAELPIGEPIDDWADSLADDDKRARLDTFFYELANNPLQVGIMVVVVTARERRDGKNRRVQFVLQHARFRQFDKSRIWFAFEPGPMKRAIFWRMLPGLEVPCNDCLIIKGGDL